MNRRRRITRRTYCLFGVLVPAVWGLWLVFGWPSAIVISHETTRLTSPLTRDGRYLDYLQALREVRPQSTAKSWKTDELGKFTAPSTGLGSIPFFVEAEGVLNKLIAEPDLSGLLNSAQSFSRDSHPELADNVETNRLWYELLIATKPGPSFVDFGTPAPGSRQLAGEIALPMASQHRKIVRRLQLLARYQFGSGQFEEGLATCRTMLQIAERTKQLPCLIDVLVSNVNETAAHETLWHGLLHHSSHDPGLLREIVAMPINSQRHLTISHVIDRTERHICLDYLQEGHRTGEWNWGPSLDTKLKALNQRMLRNRTDWNAAMRFTNQTFDGIVKAFQHPNYSARAALLKKAVQTQRQCLNEDAIQEFQDASFAGVTAPDPTPFVCHECLLQIESGRGGYPFAAVSISIARTTNACRATHIASRLAAWRLRTGEFPDRLDMILSIDGFPEAPENLLKDAFTDSEFFYAVTPDGFRMKSAGPNGIIDPAIEGDTRSFVPDDQIWNWPPPNLPTIGL